MQRAKIIWSSLLLIGIVMTTAAFRGSQPLAALALLEGRTNDKAHDTGYIDWAGPVQYVYLTHRDGSWLPADEGGAYCGSSCDEWVTRLSGGGKVSGSFATDPGIFEVNIAFSHDSSAGSAVLKACSASYTWDLYIGSGNGLPGFESAGLAVPAGCRTWSLTASGGYVDFQAVEVYYAAPLPTATRTATSAPSITPSPTWTATPTATSTYTVTPSMTPTATPTNTPSSTPTPTDTPTSTPTDTPSPTPTPLPPEITGQIFCDDWGDAGWCKGNESLQLIASDPQGYAVSIGGDLDGDPFACLDTCDVPLLEGTGAAHYTVTSASSQTASGASSWQRDATPPLLNLIVPAVDGLNGWYRSPVDISAEASDSNSGISLVQGRVDDGSGWVPLPLHLEDGFYPIEVRARDVAGNETTATDMIRIDTAPPVSDFSSHSDGAVVHGEITLTGNLSDQVSGPDSEQISLDGGSTWQPATLAAAGPWSFAWNTTGVPNGSYVVSVRGTDVAGNLGDAARLTLLIDNQPPLVFLSDHWWIWETGTLEVSQDSFPIATVQLTISDPESRWPSTIVNFEPAQIPGSISWDRHFGDGTVAPPGDYPVSVQACDSYGLCGSDSGVIRIPRPSAATRTVTPFSFPATTATATVTITPSASPTATARPMIPTRQPITPIPTSTPLSVQAARYLPWWPLLGLLGLLLAISSASIADPRPAALGQFREFIRQGSAVAARKDPQDYDESSLGKDK